MKEYALLVGNGINNTVVGKKWEDLLEKVIEFCKIEKEVGSVKESLYKPFPLFYEEIFLKASKKGTVDEYQLKKFIGQQVSENVSTEVHEAIRAMDTQHILTTNYEFCLENTTKLKNKGIVKEKLYSIFRHFEVDGKNYWHIHGDCNSPASINLGQEHYSGQLQAMRNYIATSTNYKNDAVPSRSLISRIEKGTVSYLSWLDLFFTKDIYILGLGLDFIEVDLWWLLTYRARQLQSKRKKHIKNKIYYFTPSKYYPIKPVLELTDLTHAYKEKEYLNQRYKFDLLNAVGVEIVQIDDLGADYYLKVLKWINENKLK